MVHRKSSDLDASALCSCISLHLIEERFFYLCFAEKGWTQALEANRGLRPGFLLLNILNSRKKGFLLLPSKTQRQQREVSLLPRLQHLLLMRKLTNSPWLYPSAIVTLGIVVYLFPYLPPFSSQRDCRPTQLTSLLIGLAVLFTVVRPGWKSWHMLVATLASALLAVALNLSFFG